MCIICLEIANKKMSVYEAGLALVEMRGSIGPQHAQEVKWMIKQLEATTPEETEDELTTATEE